MINRDERSDTGVGKTTNDTVIIGHAICIVFIFKAIREQTSPANRQSI
ncbi:hypothetical protein HMPREF1279_01871 [Propionibacterium sp. KPL1852]|nr:hypothetical protein HMPREF1301_02151 [Propionibacterium sp. KPL2005]ERS26284.1 hypothetical protein HMPREF1297_01863 [Propionibacterium sp. KPL2000]ERS36996.1 hypothetical protein HMPREF1271_01529 [Propionibacterium sp. KPL1838]ERS65771.1 hypothetical protein HMPREF1279_01871 [Propionibacterium sp. KPL1852]